VARTRRRRRAYGKIDAMEISAKADYAVRAVLELAAADQQLTGAELSGRAQVPHKFLEAIMGDLRLSGIVSSKRGAAGGYRLAKPSTDISIGDLIRAVDGPLAWVSGQRPHQIVYAGAAQHLATVWVAVRSALREVLDHTSVAQLLTGDFGEPVDRLLSIERASQTRWPEKGNGSP
jgi:Rrf2 family protein